MPARRPVRAEDANSVRRTLSVILSLLLLILLHSALVGAEPSRLVAVRTAAGQTFEGIRLADADRDDHQEQAGVEPKAGRHQDRSVVAFLGEFQRQL